MQFSSNMESNVSSGFEDSDALKTVSNEDCCGQSTKLLSTHSEDATKDAVGVPIDVSNDVIDVSNDVIDVSGDVINDLSYTREVSTSTNHDDPLMVCLAGCKGCESTPHGPKMVHNFDPKCSKLSTILVQSVHNGPQFWKTYFVNHNLEWNIIRS